MRRWTVGNTFHVWLYHMNDVMFVLWMAVLIEGRRAQKEDECTVLHTQVSSVFIARTVQSCVAYMISPRVCLISSKKFIPPIKIQFITRWFQVFRQTKNKCDISKGNFFSSRFSSNTTSSTSKMPQFSCHFYTRNCSIFFLNCTLEDQVLCHTMLRLLIWNQFSMKFLLHKIYARSFLYLKNMNGNCYFGKSNHDLWLEFTNTTWWFKTHHDLYRYNNSMIGHGSLQARVILFLSVYPINDSPPFAKQLLIISTCVEKAWQGPNVL